MILSEILKIYLFFKTFKNVFDNFILIIIIKICLRIKIMTMSSMMTKGQLTMNLQILREISLFHSKDFLKNINLYLLAKEHMAKYTRV